MSTPDLTTLLLIRHGMIDPIGKHLTGRRPGVFLNSEGLRQVEQLATLLAGAPLAAIYTSPMERARQTAETLARGRSLEPVIDPDLNEVEFGQWTGVSLTTLDHDPEWHRFVRARSQARVPGGEDYAALQARIIRACHAMRDRHPGAFVAAVAHGDVIRAALAYYAGMPIDFLTRLEISPASVSAVQLGGDAPRVLFSNVRPDARLWEGW